MSLTGSIIVRIVCLCYISRNIVTEGTEYVQKGNGQALPVPHCGGKHQLLVKSFLAYRLCTSLRQECISAIDLQ